MLHHTAALQKSASCNLALKSDLTRQVRIGAGCDLDMDTVAQVLEEGTDSLCVHSIGYTVTLYRCAVLLSFTGVLRNWQVYGLPIVL